MQQKISYCVKMDYLSPAPARGALPVCKSQILIIFIISEMTTEKFPLSKMEDSIDSVGSVQFVTKPDPLKVSGKVL